MPKSIDANQPEIVTALRAVGATVQHLHEVGRGCPDILVGFREENFIFEIKNPNYAWKLTPAEQKWFDKWAGRGYIVQTIEDALRIIGVS